MQRNALQQHPRTSDNERSYDNRSKEAQSHQQSPGALQLETELARGVAARAATAGTSLASNETPVGGLRRHSREERRTLALPVLRKALALLKRDGWQTQVPLFDPASKRWTLVGAIRQCGDTLRAYYATQVVSEVLFDWNLPAWEAHPSRRFRDVCLALRRAIALAGRHVRRGGWLVSVPA